MKQIQARLSILTPQTLEEWIVMVVSVQGNVHARKSGETEWVPVKVKANNTEPITGDLQKLGTVIRKGQTPWNKSYLKLISQN